MKKPSAPLKLTYEWDSLDRKNRELPFVIGVMADLRGNTSEPIPFGEREFIEIERGSFDQVLQSIKPRLTLELEATWRGIDFLLSKIEPTDNIKIRLFHSTKRDLFKAIRKFPGDRWDRNPLFKLIYDREFGACGGEPYGCLIGDYHFDHSAEDLTVLKGIAKIAGAAHVPFVTSPAPSLFGMKDWTEPSRLSCGH